MRRIKAWTMGFGFAIVLGCGDSGDSSGSGESSESSDSSDSNGSNGSGGSVGENMASFDVTGTWKGTAVDDDTEHDITLVLTNNGGTYGHELAGTLTIVDVATVPFTAATISPAAGAQRVFLIEAADEEGFAYTLTGTFTSKRVDDGKLESSNADVGSNMGYLRTTLVLEE